MTLRWIPRVQAYYAKSAETVSDRFVARKYFRETIPLKIVAIR
jgi:hypothetical protein